MDGLQTPLEEPKRVGLQRFCQPTSVGSIGFLGIAGLTQSSTSASVGWGLEGPLLSRELLPSSRQTPSTGYRTRELEWRRTHTETLRSYADQWVVLEGEQIVAHGTDPLHVLAQARATGIRTPYIFYVEAPNENLIKIGL